MIKEYLLIGDTLYPMLPDGSENIEVLDSKVWNVYRGDELVGMITMQMFQPVLMEFESFTGMKVYLSDKEMEDGDVTDIYALAGQGEEIHEYDVSQAPEENILSENMHVQEALPNERIMSEAIALKKATDEKQQHHDIIQEANSVALIDTLREKHESVHEITSIFGRTIEEAIEFLKSEGEIVGFDAVIGVHEENNQRCIVMHESVEHREERERVEEELRAAAMAKLTDEEKRALGIK